MEHVAHFDKSLVNDLCKFIITLIPILLLRPSFYIQFFVMTTFERQLLGIYQISYSKPVWLHTLSNMLMQRRDERNTLIIVELFGEEASNALQC